MKIIVDLLGSDKGVETIFIWILNRKYRKISQGGIR